MISLQLYNKETKTYTIILILFCIAGNRFPGAEDIPDGLAAFPALAATKDGQGALIAMVSTMLLLEICMRDADWSDTTPEFPGDYRNGVNGFGKKAWDNYTPEQKLKKRTIELNNGRAGKLVYYKKCSYHIMSRVFLFFLSHAVISQTMSFL